MEVVLRQDVDHVGLRGDVVSVARGYARNYLLPRGLAEPATPGLLRELQRRDSIRARHEAKSTDEAQSIAERLEATELRFEVNAGPTGALFGSVTATNVADRLWEEQKIRIDRRKLGLETIKRIGRYTVPVEVFADVTAELRLLVVPEGGELPPDEPEAAEVVDAVEAAEPVLEAAPAAEAFDEVEPAAVEEPSAEPPVEPVAELSSADEPSAEEPSVEPAADALDAADAANEEQL